MCEKMKNTSNLQQPLIGILGWEAGNPDTLAQLEEIPGNIAHPKTFDFPVEYKRITGAIVLECTDLPPFAAALRRALRLPVFDIVTLANWVYESICTTRERWNRSKRP